MVTIGDREALVFLAIGSEIWRAHIVRGRVGFERLPADAVDVAYRFRLHPGDRAAGERASTVLLPADLAVSRSPLYVIASGALAEVPFAALHSRGRYLIEDRPVARLPGLVALRCAASAWDPRAVVIGDSRGDLPEAAREVQRIAASNGAVPRVGAAASRSALAPAHGARLLHVAAHGITTSSGHAIALADGNLTAADVLESDLDPEVVVLAGCATAASDDAESWDGFPSAFLAAGSRYVVATLRSVEDAAAARVTSAYYAQPASMSPIERLAAAQRTLVDVLPVEAWASFAAWGSDACDNPSSSSPPERAK
jgi:CHAT domain-containing protein